MTHRLFAALPVSDDLAGRLLPLKLDGPGLSWRRADQYHVTLHFFGGVSIELAEEIAFRLDRIAFLPFQFAVAGVGWFGRRQPRALYARLAPSAELEHLASACRDIARELKLEHERRPFTPHITLAYCNETPIDNVKIWANTYQALRTDHVSVDQFHLYESFTGRGTKSRYQIQATYRSGS